MRNFAQKSDFMQKKAAGRFLRADSRTVSLNHLLDEPAFLQQQLNVCALDLFERHLKQLLFL